jgi:hypothetical protein
MTALQIDQAPERNRVATDSLCLTFDRTLGDRWRHAVDIRTDSDWQTLFTSAEGSAADTDPPSPAFQDLRLEVVDSATAEFQLFGQAGQRVYSAAVRFNGATDAIDFDVCCRVPVKRLGGPIVSSYDWPDGRGESIVSDSDPPSPLRLPSHSVEIELPSLPNAVPCAWRTTGEGSSAMLQFGRFDVAAVEAASSVVTIRWRYVIRRPLP